MKIFKATIADIEDLIQLRIDFLKTDIGYLSLEDELAIQEQLTKYFEKHLQIGDCIAMIAKIDAEIISAAFLILQERPANPSFITGKTGTLMNVLTYPEYRRKGIATQVIKALIEEAKTVGVSSIDLYATEDGKSLYEELGFEVPSYTAMRLNL